MLSLTVPALHSDPGEAITIYLDFDGQVIRNTAWNTNGFGNIVNLPFDTDGDLTTFSSDELDTIQSVWERVSEDFRPFDVDVTTVDPGVEALKNTGGGDTQWGQRVVIGGGSADWYTMVNPPDPNSMAHPAIVRRYARLVLQCCPIDRQRHDGFCLFYRYRWTVRCIAA